MKQATIGPATGLLKPKYRVINTLLGEGFNPRGLDVFIDLNSVMSAITLTNAYVSALPFTENAEKDIISSLLFTFKHWKDYTRKFQDVRIFMMINDFEMVNLDESEASSSYLMPHTNKFRQERFDLLKKHWNNAMEKVSVILKYIPGAYFIKCDRFDSFVLPEILSDSSERFKIVITSSSLMTNYVYIPHSYVIYSKFSNPGTTQLSDPTMIVQSITKINDPIMSTFCQNKVFYNLLNAIIGELERGIIGLSQMGITSFASDLLRAVEKSEIPSNPMNVESVLSVVKPQFHPHVKQSYPLIDIPSHASMVKMSNIEKIKANMIDLCDIQGLNQLSIDGLNLLELM